MQRLHPQFIKINPNVTDQKQITAEFMAGAEKGVDYWVNTINREIGSVPMLDTPVIIAALHIIADTYEKLAPGAKDAAKTIRSRLKVYAFAMKEKEHV